MNCAALRSGEDIILIDAGMTFPRKDLGSELGVNVVVPDIAFLREHQDQVRAIFLTHGHEDHVGAVAYIIREIPVPVYGSRLTLGLVEKRLKEFGLDSDADLRPMHARDQISIGSFDVEPVSITHSFPDSFAFIIECDAGRLIWTGDFKFDQTPRDGIPTDMARLAECGEKGVLALFSDSTNSPTPGLAPSESTVRKPLRDCFLSAQGRIVISCFSSSIHRVQTVFDLAREFGRSVVAAGRSLSSNIEIASRLGYLSVPTKVLVTSAQARRLPPEDLVILASGSQGEPMSALSRLAVGEFKGVEIVEGDLVILSARVIPGNEKRIANLTNHFYRRGARVIGPSDQKVHASGHGFREDLKLMLTLTRPRHFVPIHGDFRQLKEHLELARMQGLEEENIHLIENGDVLRFEEDSANVVDKVPVGRRFIDEGHAGEVQEVVLRERKFLSEDGILVVVLRIDRFGGELIGEPELISPGFVLMEEREGLAETIKNEVVAIVESTPAEEIADEDLFHEILRKGLKKFLRKQTGKRPMILPITLEI